MATGGRVVAVGLTAGNAKDMGRSAGPPPIMGSKGEPMGRLNCGRKGDWEAGVGGDIIPAALNAAAGFIF